MLLKKSARASECGSCANSVKLRSWDFNYLNTETNGVGFPEDLKWPAWGVFQQHRPKAEWPLSGEQV